MIVPSHLRALRLDQNASAATEMALALPLLLLLMFGSFEMGRFFLDEHAVLKAVRDGARYASRQGFAAYTCPGATVTTDVVDRTRNVVRYGKPVVTAGDSPRLPYWQATTDGQPSVQVTVTCPTTLDGTEAHGGIYTGKTHVPVVTVAAAVEYDSLFAFLGFADAGYNLTAESQTAVMGI